MRRKPAHCSNAFGPSRGTSLSALRERNGPWASRWRTMFCARPAPIPEIRASSGAEVVLVLADADGFRIDLDELGQRILQPASDRDRTAQRHVEVGQLLRGEGGS